MKFNYENASLHFLRTGGPRGFVWKYALAYTLLSIVFFGLIMLLFGGVYATLLGGFAPSDASALEQSPSVGSIVLMYAIILPISLLFYAVFETCFLRRYMRGDGFKLRIGRDEFNVMVVLFIWFAIMVGLLVVFAMIATIAGMSSMAAVSEDNPVVNPTGFMVIFFAYIALFGVIAFLGIRFGPAAALTVRDGRIRFLDAWQVTKGRWWVLFGAYSAWWSMAFIAYFFVIMILIAFTLPFSFAVQTGEPISSTGMMVGMSMFYLLLLPAGACFYYIWAGPAALAAKTDPRLTARSDAVPNEPME